MALAISEVLTSIGEHQRSYLYKFVIENAPSGLPAGFTGIMNNMDLMNQQGVWFQPATSEIEMRWSGERIHWSGYDNTEKKVSLKFRTDESGLVEDFWLYAKSLSGDYVNHAAQPRSTQTFSIGIYRIDVTKTKVTNYRGFDGFFVTSVKPAMEARESNSIVTCDVEGFWTSVRFNDSLRGKQI